MSATPPQTAPRRIVAGAILEGHTDEVWNLEWSHGGDRLATASRDGTVIVWRFEAGIPRMYSQEHFLSGHDHPVGIVTWSPDDTKILSTSDRFIRLWDAQTGSYRCTIDSHKEAVTGAVWLPDGSGFFSAGLDRQIFLWDADGRLKDAWGDIAAMRIVDLAITPDSSTLIVSGRLDVRPDTADSSSSQETEKVAPTESQIVGYNLATRQRETLMHSASKHFTSVRVSRDSRYALVSCIVSNSSEGHPTIYMLDLSTKAVARRFTGHRQSYLIIRSCFVGVEEEFVVSGSEDGNVYVWDRHSGALIRVLSAHGTYSVNSVAWNPVHQTVFASCSDDKVIRIWERSTADAPVDSDSERP